MWGEIGTYQEIHGQIRSWESKRDDMKTFKMKTSESTNIKSFISQLQWGQDRSSLARSTWSLSTPVPLLLLAGQLFTSSVNSLRKMHLWKMHQTALSHWCIITRSLAWEMQHRIEEKNFQQKDNWETQSNQRDSFIIKKSDCSYNPAEST